MLGRNEEALAAAETARNLDPDGYFSRLALAIQLVRGGDIDRALILMVGAQRASNSEVVTYYIGLHVLARNFDKALEAVHEITDELEIARSHFACASIGRPKSCTWQAVKRQHGTLRAPRSID